MPEPSTAEGTTPGRGGEPDVPCAVAGAAADAGAAAPPPAAAAAPEGPEPEAEAAARLAAPGAAAPGVVGAETRGEVEERVGGACVLPCALGFWLVLVRPTWMELREVRMAGFELPTMLFSLP